MKKTYWWMGVLVLLSCVTTGVFLSLAPDVIPVHYNAAGAIDRWGSKYEYLLLPAVTALMGIFFFFVLRNEEKKARQSNAKTVGIVGILVLLQFNIMWIFFFVSALKSAEMTGGFEIGVKGMFVLMMAFFMLMGNLMPKTKRNGAFGLRTKWSMADDVCWQKSQRLGGYSMMITGALGIAVISLAPVEWGAWGMLVLLLAMTITDIAGTYWIWKKEHCKE